MTVFRPYAAIVAALPLAATPAIAAEIHVYAGDNFESAAESLQPGDDLIVHAGTYEHSSRLAIRVRGTANEPVVIRGADGEATPVIALTASGQNVIDIDGASHLTLRDLEITANGIGGADGINMRGTPSDITLENLTIHDISVGINFRSSMSNIVVRRNHIYNTNDTGEGMYVGCHDGSCAVSNSIIENNWIHDTTNADQGDGIEVKRGSHSNIIRDNVIHDTRYPCIILYGTEGNPRNVVERNVMWNCQDAAIQAAADTLFRNNILLPGSGRGFASQPHAGVDTNNIEFVHNTIVGGSPCIYTNGWSGKTNMVFANNAVYCSSGNYSFNGVGGVSLTGNVFAPMPGAVSAADNAEGRSEAQDFMDASQRDLYPTSDSALLSAGHSNFLEGEDFNGTARSGVADAGAYAWTGAVNPGWTIAPGFKGAVAAAPTMTLSADPATVAYQGEATLSWDSSNANGCDASGTWSGTRAVSGNEVTGALTADSTYTLECSGPGGSISRSVTVQVQSSDTGGGGSGGGGSGGSGDNPAASSGGGTLSWLLVWLLLIAASYTPARGYTRVCDRDSVK